MARRRSETRPRRGIRVIGRLGIRGKLNLLLLLPLAAVLLVAVPFVLGQVDNAQSAGRTADTARQARELGALISDLQRERLLTAAYVASPSADSAAMEEQQRAVNDTVNEVRVALGSGASDELTSALVRLGSIEELRQSALRRGVSLDSVARTYHAVISAVIDALRLVPQKTSDAEGTRQLTALEALLRANEQNALRGMALIVAAVSPQTGQVLLDDASAEAQTFTERFVQQADVEHAGLVVRVDQGDEGRQVDELATRVRTEQAANANEAFVADALGVVESQSNLRRLVQDRVTSQITDAAAGRAENARTVAWTVGIGAAVLFVLVAILAILVSRSIANPLRRLTTAAATVADLADTELVRVTDTEQAEEQVPRLAAIDVSSSDELGKLAAAFNRVQATAAMLVERQAITRRNVSLMFANVAQRTQNLVGRQLTLVDELERNEQNSRLLASLYRLDHLSTRLRRNADNLLVVAGTRDETKLAGPTELPTALRSALAEIEEYKRVRLGDIAEVMVPPSLGSDLISVFAELLENATSFSPPDSVVEVGTGFLTNGCCVVSIADHGIGMPPERLAEENRRLVERERLDIAPTSVLGLFVVGRLARRHSLAVELAATPGGGVTARVGLPAGLFSRPAVPAPVAERAADVGGAAAERRLQRIPPARHTAGFSWFPSVAAPPAAPRPVPEPGPAITPHQAAVASHVAAASQAAGMATSSAARASLLAEAEKNASPMGDMPRKIRPNNAAGTNRGGLRRRVAGAQLPGAAVEPKTSAPADRPKHDPDAVRAAMDDYQSAVARAASTVTPEPPVAAPPPPVAPPPTPPPTMPIAAPVTAPDAGHGGLTRRVPGANLAPGLRNEMIPAPNRAPGLRNQPSGDPQALRARDPDAERAAFDAFTLGLADAASRDTDPMKGST